MEPVGNTLSQIGATIWKYTKKIGLSVFFFGWTLLLVEIAAIPAAWEKAVDAWKSVQ